MQITLKGKLLIGISGLILLLVAVMTFNSYQKTKEIIIAQEENHFAVLENIVGVEIDNYLSRGEMLVKFVAEDIETIKAFADRERNGLALIVKGRYNALQDEGVNVLQFHLPDGTSFYRAHQPEKYGDSVMFRDTIKTIVQEKQPIKALEEGVAGFSFRAIEPVYEFGQYIGSVEVGMDVESVFVEELKEILENEVFVYTLTSEDDTASLIGGTMDKDYFPVP
ncbi:MAG: hypothetical protein GX262_12460, partial [Clostridia bacterium]|nr:hypothetical protein [Clostridia bacterium]